MTTTTNAESMLYTAPIRFEDDDNICFAVTTTPSAEKIASLNAKLEAVANAEPSDLYRLLTPRIAAIGRSKKGGAFQVQTPPVVEITEADVLNNALDCLRLGLVEPVHTMTAEVAAEINREAIGPQCQWDGTRGIE